jgi:hypothetical protein
VRFIVARLAKCCPASHTPKNISMVPGIVSGLDAEALNQLAYRRLVMGL